MSQPVAGDSWTNIGTIGTTVITSRIAVLRSVIIPGTYVGTVIFHDAPSATGTTGTSALFTVGLPASSIPVVLPVNIQCRYGIVCQATGTPVLTFTWA